MGTNKIYDLWQRQIKDKDTAVSEFITAALAKTARMFVYSGLPCTIPQTELERILQTTGSVFVTETPAGLYALSGGKGGELDAYGQPTIYTVSNPALNINKSYNISTDGILINNDSNGCSLLPLLGKYGVLYTDALISLNTASVLTRITMLISASDEQTRQSAEAFLEKILAGDFSVIGENAFFKGVTMQTSPTANSSYITQLIELVQYYRASLCNDLGLNANYNMKRERLNLGEVSMNVDLLLPYVDNMLNERQTAVEQINARYGLEITVDLGSSWKLEKENYEVLTEATETAITTEPAKEDEPAEPTEPKDEPKDEPKEDE